MGSDPLAVDVAHSLGNCAVLNSATGTRTRVARVRAEYLNQLDYSGLTCDAVVGARFRFLVAFASPCEIPTPGLEPGALR